MVDESSVPLVDGSSVLPVDENSVSLVDESSSTRRHLAPKKCAHGHVRTILGQMW